MSILDEIREASANFYAALNHMANGDASRMTEVWSHGDSVTTMHPIGGREIGWDAVRASFEQVAQAASDGKIELGDQFIHVAGDLAYELGVEHGELKLAGSPALIEHRVTNIYQRQNGVWKIIHHHTDTAPTMIEIVREMGDSTSGL